MLVSLAALLPPLEQSLPLLLQHTVSLMPSLSGPFTPILMAQSAPPPQVSSPPSDSVPHRCPWGQCLRVGNTEGFGVQLCGQDRSFSIPGLQCPYQ